MDSNHRMTVSKAAALPLGYTPMYVPMIRSFIGTMRCLGSRFIIINIRRSFKTSRMYVEGFEPPFQYMIHSIWMLIDGLESTFRIDNCVLT